MKQAKPAKYLSKSSSKRRIFLVHSPNKFQVYPTATSTAVERLLFWWVGGDLDIFKLMSSLLVMVLMQGFLTEHFRPIGPNHKELWSYLFRL